MTVPQVRTSRRLCRCHAINHTMRVSESGVTTRWTPLRIAHAFYVSRFRRRSQEDPKSGTCRTGPVVDKRFIAGRVLRRLPRRTQISSRMKSRACEAIHAARVLIKTGNVIERAPGNKAGNRLARPRLRVCGQIAAHRTYQACLCTRTLRACSTACTRAIRLRAARWRCRWLGRRRGPEIPEVLLRRCRSRRSRGLSAIRCAAACRR